MDDSALIRSVMSEIISSQADMEVVGVAPDPLVARELIKQTNPDVLTLDVEMPKMDGLDFLEKLMRLRPMPVLMVSSLTERGSEITMRAGAGRGRFRHQAEDLDPERDARIHRTDRR
ncbi:response regulator [Massilia sp. B-10]|nr:response regulator [Massilia sp. B-10]